MLFFSRKAQTLAKALAAANSSLSE